MKYKITKPDGTTTIRPFYSKIEFIEYMHRYEPSSTAMRIDESAEIKATTQWAKTKKNFIECVHLTLEARHMAKEHITKTCGQIPIFKNSVPLDGLAFTITHATINGNVYTRRKMFSAHSFKTSTLDPTKHWNTSINSLVTEISFLHHWLSPVAWEEAWEANQFSPSLKKEFNGKFSYTLR